MLFLCSIHFSISYFLIMKKKSTIHLIKAFLILIICSFLTASAAAQDILQVKKRTLTEKKFTRKLHKKDALLLDVRTAAEYKEGHLPGAENIDVQQQDFEEKIAQLDKKKTVLVYCKSGRRSAKALQILHKAGFTKAYHLKGGYTDWDGEKVQ